ncbi:hypothetical protein D3C74_286930 [compost metagenome]
MFIGQAVWNFVNHMCITCYVFREAAATAGKTEEAHFITKVVFTLLTSVTFTAGKYRFYYDTISDFESGYTCTYFNNLTGEFMSHDDRSFFTSKWMFCIFRNEDRTCYIFVKVTTTNSAPFNFNFYFTFKSRRFFNCFQTKVFHTVPSQCLHELSSPNIL